MNFLERLPPLTSMKRRLIRTMYRVLESDFNRRAHYKRVDALSKPAIVENIMDRSKDIRIFELKYQLNPLKTKNLKRSRRLVVGWVDLIDGKLHRTIFWKISAYLTNSTVESLDPEEFQESEVISQFKHQIKNEKTNLSRCNYVTNYSKDTILEIHFETSEQIDSYVRSHVQPDFLFEDDDPPSQIPTNLLQTLENNMDPFSFLNRETHEINHHQNYHVVSNYPKIEAQNGETDLTIEEILKLIKLLYAPHIKGRQTIHGEPEPHRDYWRVVKYISLIEDSAYYIQWIYDNTTCSGVQLSLNIEKFGSMESLWTTLPGKIRSEFLKECEEPELVDIGFVPCPDESDSEASE